MWLGVNSVGAYTPPDITGGAIIGVTVGITSGGGVAAGVAFAVPAATLILQLIVLLQTYLSVHIHRAEAAAVAGDFDKANRWHLYSGILLFFWRVPFLASSRYISEIRCYLISLHGFRNLSLPD